MGAAKITRTYPNQEHTSKQPYKHNQADNEALAKKGTKTKESGISDNGKSEVQ
jgi:hypothetical protein